MPVYVMGRDSGQNPLSLGNVETELGFIWSLGKLGVLEIQPRHKQVKFMHTKTYLPTIQKHGACK